MLPDKDQCAHECARDLSQRIAQVVDGQDTRSFRAGDRFKEHQEHCQFVRGPSYAARELQYRDESQVTRNGPETGDRDDPQSADPK